MCCSTCRATRPTASCPAATARRCWPVRGSRWRPTSAIPPTSCCGSRARKAWSDGTARGAAAGPAGIECSAMIRAHLGETIDIHGGGLDLIFRIMRMRSPRAAAPTMESAGPPLGAQRLRRHGRRENVEEPRQRHSPAELLAPATRARRCASPCCRALSPAAAVDRKPDCPEQGGPRPLVPGARRYRAGRSGYRALCRGAERRSQHAEGDCGPQRVHRFRPAASERGV